MFINNTLGIRLIYFNEIYIRLTIAAFEKTFFHFIGNFYDCILGAVILVQAYWINTAFENKEEEFSWREPVPSIRIYKSSRHRNFRLY